MRPLLTKSILNQITRQLYGQITLVFYRVTPAEGEQELARTSQGVTFVREEPGGGRDGSGVKVWLSTDAGISRTLLKKGAVVGLTINGNTTRYVIDQFLPQQQLGAGYVLRLLPQTGAAG